MKSTKLSPDELLAKSVENLKERYGCWHDIYQNGCDDPISSDGCNLHLVRNHIRYYKKEIFEICKKYQLPLPEEYQWPMVPEVGFDYMAQPDAIRAKGEARYKYLANLPAYIELLTYGEMLSPKQKDAIGYSCSIGIVGRLKNSLDKDNLVDIRCFTREGAYTDYNALTDSFKDSEVENIEMCLSKAKRLAPESYQLSLF